MDWEWFRLDAWLAESYVIEEGARRALHVLDVPLPLGAPELAMSPADNL